MIKQEFSIDQQEDEDLRCPICNFYFSSLTKPYILPCSHNLCIKCIDCLIEKQMLNCPLCRLKFSLEDRGKLQVNFSFFSLVTKILKTKVIYCKKCSMIFNWTDHHQTCDENEFKEVDEIIEEIKKLSEDCYRILRSFEKHKNILGKSRKMIFDTSNEIIKNLQKIFCDNFQRTIEMFFDNIPHLDFAADFMDMLNFLELCQNMQGFDYNISSFRKFLKRNASHRRNNSTYSRSSKDSNQMTDYWDDTEIGYGNTTCKTESLHNKKPYPNRRIHNFSISSFLIKEKPQVIDEESREAEDSNFHVTEDEETNKECDSKDYDEDSEYAKGIPTEKGEDNRNMIKIHNTKKMDLKTNHVRNASLFDRHDKQENCLNSILGFNGNVSISDLFHSENNNTGGNHMDIDSITTTEEPLATKQKIIVRCGKVEIINIDDKKAKPVSSENHKANNQTFALPEPSCQSRRRVKASNERYKSLSPFRESDRNSHISNHMRKPETPKSSHHMINTIISHFNKTKETANKIIHYTQQVELTSETIKAQVSTNFTQLNEKITTSINGLYDNITVNFKNHSRRYIIHIIEGSKMIWLFDVRKMSSEIKEFSFLKNKLNYSMSIEYDDCDLIFLTGGKVSTGYLFPDDEKHADQFYVFRWSNGPVKKSFEVTGRMPRRRSKHGSLYFDKRIYLIGGISSQNSKIRECECYNIIDKRWELLPSLNNARSDPSLCIYNQSYLYVFRGYNDQDNCLDTIEFLNINHITLGWTLIKPEDPGKCWEQCALSSVTVLSERKILICGGIDCTKRLSSSSFIFDPVKKCVYRGKDLEKSSCFSTPGVLYEGNVILIDLKNETGIQFGVHVFDIAQSKWNFN